MAQALLETKHLSKFFGGVAAVDSVYLEVQAGELMAIIGPNGAGKTTFVNLLTGELAPDGGQVIFDGKDITRLPVHARSMRGLARSFQITSIFADMSVRDNVALSVQAHGAHSFRFWRFAHADEALRTNAMARVSELGLEGRAHTLAGALAHGEKRQLEIAMALATRPKLLLLDEPMAGMGPEESRRMIGFLRSLKSTVTIVLIEHDMDAVFALADRIMVLASGAVVAIGSPAAIRSDQAVRAAYLGEDDLEA